MVVSARGKVATQVGSALTPWAYRVVCFISESPEPAVGVLVMAFVGAFVALDVAF